MLRRQLQHLLGKGHNFHLVEDISYLGISSCSLKARVVPADDGGQAAGAVPGRRVQRGGGAQGAQLLSPFYRRETVM